MSKKIPSYQNVIGYRALSIGFLYPTETELERLKNMIIEWNNLPLTLPLSQREREYDMGKFTSFPLPLGEGLRVRGRLKQLLPMIPEDLGPLQQEHFRLFGPNPVVYLDLAFYFSDNPFEQAKKMADMAGFLRAFGVDIENGNRVDNLSVCLDFLSYLHLKGLNAEEKGLSEPAETTQKAIRSYVQDFLGFGVRSFCQKLAEQSQNQFYNLLGKITLECVTEEQK